MAAASGSGPAFALFKLGNNIPTNAAELWSYAKGLWWSVVVPLAVFFSLFKIIGLAEPIRHVVSRGRCGACAGPITIGSGVGGWARLC